MTKQVEFASWPEFEAAARQLWGERDRANREHPSNQRLLFRGQADAAWPLATTLERRVGGDFGVRDYLRIVLAVKAEIESLTSREWAMPDLAEIEQTFSDYDSGRLSFTFHGIPAYAYLAHLRHHGFPSPTRTQRQLRVVSRHPPLPPASRKG